jgi:hypothetical protein
VRKATAKEALVRSLERVEVSMSREENVENIVLVQVLG